MYTKNQFPYSQKLLALIIKVTKSKEKIYFYKNECISINYMV